MSNSFFISNELKNIVTKDTLSRDAYGLPFVCISNKKYNVIGVDISKTNEIKLSFTCDESFKLSEQLIIENASIFGVSTSDAQVSFKKLYYSLDQKKYICEIVIDKEIFWS